MGNQETKNQYDNPLDERNWIKRVGENGRNQYQNAQNGSFCVQEYYLSAENDKQLEEYKRMYESRKNSNDLVASHHMKINEGKEVCSSSSNGQLYLEKIPVTLSNVTDIPFPDVLHAYDQCLNGFEKIKGRYGNCSVYEDCIGINNKNIVKVWHSHEYDKLYPSGRTQTEENMVKGIISIIQNNTDIKTMPPQQPSMMNYLLRENAMNFKNAKVKLVEYADKYNNGIIPFSLKCAQRAGGSDSIRNTLGNEKTSVLHQNTNSNHYINNNNNSMYHHKSASHHNITNISNNTLHTHTNTNTNSKVAQQPRYNSPRVSSSYIPVEQDRVSKSQLYIGPPMYQHQYQSHNTQPKINSSPIVVRDKPTYSISSVLNSKITQSSFVKKQTNPQLRRSTDFTNNNISLNNKPNINPATKIYPNSHVHVNPHVRSNSNIQPNPPPPQSIRRIVNEQVINSQQQQHRKPTPIQSIANHIPHHQVINNSQFHKLQRKANMMPEERRKVQVRNVQVNNINNSNTGNMPKTEVRQIPHNVQVRMQPMNPQNNSMVASKSARIPPPLEVMHEANVVRHQKGKVQKTVQLNTIVPSQQLANIEPVTYPKITESINTNIFDNDTDTTPSQLLQKLLMKSPPRQYHEDYVNYAEYEPKIVKEQEMHNQYKHQYKSNMKDLYEKMEANAESRQKIVQQVPSNNYQHQQRSSQGVYKYQVKPIITQLRQVQMKQSIIQQQQYNVEWDPQILADLQTRTQ